MAWRALTVGATGIGTSSFDDTRGGSVFDGIGPDWTPVYEGKDGFLPSRRCYALLRGAREVRLVKDKLPPEFSSKDYASMFAASLRSCERNGQ